LGFELNKYGTKGVMGRDEDTSALEQRFRARYEIAADIPIVPGPALTDAGNRV